MFSPKRYLFSAAVLVLAGCSGSQPAGPDATEEASGASPALSSPSTAAVDPNDPRQILVVFGDSLSAGYGLERGESYPDVLQRRLDELGVPWRVVNLGISGDTTEGGAARVDSAVSLGPDLVLLELGGNDGLRGLPLTATRENMEEMIGAFQGAGAEVVLAGMTLPPNYGPDYVHGFEQLYRDLATEHKLKLIPFLLADMITDDLRYFQNDGIHPTKEGAEIVAGTVYDALKPMLQ